MGNPAAGEPSGTYRRKSLMDTMAVAPELQTREESVATTGVQQATLTVWKFPTATGAAEAVKTVSALFSYTSGAIVDKVQAAMKPHNPTLLTSNLSAD